MFPLGETMPICGPSYKIMQTPQSNKGCINKLYIWFVASNNKHSFARLEALLFLFVKVPYEFRLLFSTSQKHVVVELSALLLVTVSFYSI